MNNQDNVPKDAHWSNEPSIPPYINYENMWQQNQMRSAVPIYNQSNDYMYQQLQNRNNPGPMIGLQALCAACTRLYPNQPNPLQVTARIKYWLGGPDPLDYISMYWNTGCKDLNIPPHWHYISFGLSDLHGDGRVHPRPPPDLLTPDCISGLGLEISFRILGDPRQPPTWPAALLQRLATYIFNTGNRLCVGDHISWHNALDGSDEVDCNIINKVNNIDNKKKSRRKCKIRHMLIAADNQLGTVDTPLGKVQFVQIVGVTDRELKAAQRSGGNLILEAIARDDRSGGPWFVTDMERRHSVSLPDVSHTASDLSGVAANCHWEYWEPNVSEITSHQKDNSHNRNSSELSQNVKDQIKNILQKGLSEISLQPAHEVDNANKTCDAKNETSIIKTEVQAANNNFTDECKMSTDSIKFLSLNDCAGKSSVADKTVASKDLSMLTDSFEMSKIGAALIEDIKAQDKQNDHKNMPIAKISNNTQSIKEEDVNKNDIGAIKNEENEELSNRKCINNEIRDCAVENPYALSDLYAQDCRRVSQNEIWSQDAIAFHGVHIIFDHESGSMLPQALRRRILHGRHFTWKSVGEVQAITLVASNVSGSIVTPEHPVAANNGWLQLLITNEFAEEMANDLEMLANDDDDDSDSEDNLNDISPKPTYPLCFAWPHKGLKITVMQNVK